MRERILDAVALLAALVALCLAGFFFWERAGGGQPDSQAEITMVSDWVKYTQQGHRIGNAAAPVTVVEFGDYECPGCRLFHQSLTAAKRALGDSFSLVYRHSPLEAHPRGQVAARAAECAAEQGRFEPYHNMLYEDPSWLGLGSRAFEVYASAVGVADSTAFATCLYSIEPVTSIERDRAAAVSLGVAATPTILINEKLMVGPDSIRLIELIRDALED